MACGCLSRVMHLTCEAFAAVRWSGVQGSERRFVLQELGLGERFDLRVCACNECGAGEFSRCGLALLNFCES